MEPTRLTKLSFPLFPFFLTVLLFPSILAGTDDLAGNPIRLVTDSSRPSFTHLLLNAEEHFHEFLKRFNKKYSGPEEHKRRFSIFKSNLLEAMHHQALNPTAIHGITKFSDLTEEEFSSMYLGLHQIPREFSRLEPAPVLRTDDLPESFDWRESGAVTPVKDQGSCGSCWSFSAAGALEGAHFLKTRQLLNLSQQQLVDCDHECEPVDEGMSCNSGCFGGLMTNAFRYAIKAGGLQREEDYPYRGIEGTCKFDKSKVAAKMANFSIVSADEHQIAANLIKHGPLSGAEQTKMKSTLLRFLLGIESLPQLNIISRPALKVLYSSPRYLANCCALRHLRKNQLALSSRACIRKVPTLLQSCHKRRKLDLSRVFFVNLSADNLSAVSSTSLRIDAPVAINAKFMQSYVGGISCPLMCSKRLNHGVLLVGYGSGEYAKERLRKMPFWAIKNSWGADWGEDGYYKVCRGYNKCGVNDMVSSVIAATP